MLCEELAKLTPPEGYEEFSSYPQFEYKPPSSPASPTPCAVTTAAPVPGTSASSSSSSLTLPPQQATAFGEIEKIMAELD